MNQPIHNNLTVVSQSREVDDDQSLGKIMLLGGLALGSIALMCYMLRLFILKSVTPFLTGSVIMGIVSILFFLLIALCIKSRKKIILITLLIVAVVFGVLYDYILAQNSFITVFLGGVIAFCMYSGLRRGMRAVQNSMKINTYHSAHAALPRILTGMSLFVGGVVYIVGFQGNALNPHFGQSFTNGMLKSAEPIVRLLIPDFSFNKTVDEVIGLVIRKELEKEQVNILKEVGGTMKVGNNAFSEAQTKEFITKKISEVKEMFQKNIGPFQGTQKIGDVLYGLVTKNTQKFSYGPMIEGGVFALLIFFTIRSVAGLFSFVFLILTTLLFKFMVALGFITLTTEMRSREFVVLK